MPERPEVTHLGTTAGEWPVHAFPSESMAASWAAEGKPGRERYVWAIERLVLGIPRRARMVPATAVLEPLDEPAEAASSDG